MKRTPIISILALSIVAGHAQTQYTQSPAEFAAELRAPMANPLKAYDDGFIMGILKTDPHVCIPPGTNHVDEIVEAEAKVIESLPNKSLTVVEQRNLLVRLTELLNPGYAGPGCGKLQ
jgi:hypothetical protein